jgi:ATP-binding cassette subfamily B protein
MQRLFGYLVRYRRRYTLGLVCLFLTASLAMALPYLFKWAVDAHVEGRGGGTVARYALAMGVIAIVQAIVRTFSRAVVFNVGRDVEYDLRNDLFAKLEALPPNFYRRRSTGDLMSRLVNDITALRLVLGVGVLNLINTTMYYAYGVTIMSTLDPGLTLWALLPFPLLLVAVKRFSRQIIERSLSVQEGLAELSSRVQENLSGMHVVQAYGRARRETEIFAELNERFAAENLALARARGVLLPVMKVVASLGTVVVLWLGGRRVMAGQLTIGDLLAFIWYLNILAWPTMAMGWMLTIFQRGRAAMQRLEEIFSAPVELEGPPGATIPDVVGGAIEFRGVDFRYEDGDNGHRVLRDINVTIPAGSTVAIVGRTGSGKSTLAQLLPRLFDPSAGAVLLDGRDLRSYPLRWLRQQIAVVSQEPFLFSASIAHNIVFGAARPANGGDGVTPVQDGHGEVPSARGEPDVDARWAADQAGLGGDLDSLPRGLETMVGERGVTLSGGQKQRVTLARALLAAPRILILDDALSSVDSQTERAVLGNLATFMRGRTSILIAHRVSTVRNADLIVVLEDGAVAETGDHDALVARNGIYAELFRRQCLEEELEAI